MDCVKDFTNREVKPEEVKNFASSVRQQEVKPSFPAGYQHDNQNIFIVLLLIVAEIITDSFIMLTDHSNNR